MDQNVCPETKAPSFAQCVACAFSRYRKEEDGSFVLFGIYLFILMLLVGGLSVDIMRHDYSRLQMQGTLDSAILAAADLDQTLDPEEVVRDYFDKAGVLQFLDNVSVEQNINSRVVTADASMDVDTMFIRSLGIDSIGADAAGRAREEISDIEVSMVLDVSGSMGSFGRLDDLKVAAKSFVTTVLNSRDGALDRDDDVSISMFPYSTQVSLPPVLLDRMNLGRTHDRSSCVDLVATDFTSTSLNLSTWRKQTGHFDPFSYGGEDNPSPTATSYVCRTDAAMQSTLFSQNETALHSQIDDFQPNGNTSIDVGLAWGSAFLDPAMRTHTDDLVKAGEADEAFEDRPYDFGRNNTMKVLVVMTDGANTDQYRLKDAYNGSNLTDVWSDIQTNSDGEQVRRYWMKDTEINNKDGDSEWSEAYYRPDQDDWTNTLPGSAKRLTYEELWDSTSLIWHAYHGRYTQYNQASTFYSWRDSPRDFIGTSAKNSRMVSICNAAKAKDIIVYTIALDITEANAILMKQCATSANHYFNVTGEDLRYAFTAIASSINQLRLTQ